MNSCRQLHGGGLEGGRSCVFGYIITLWLSSAFVIFREVDALADKVSSGLQLDPGGQLLDIEELVYKASPAELEALRKQVLQKQTL